MSFHNISIHKIQESDINKLIESINAIESTYERVHDGFFLKFKYGEVFKAIDNLNIQIKTINNKKNINSNLSERYLQLLEQVYEFYSTLKNENYLRADFKELLANKLQDLQEAKWESYEDNGTALNFLKIALREKFQEEEEKDKVWDYLCRNLLSKLEDDNANGFVFTIEEKIGLHSPESNLNENLNEKERKNKIRGLDLIIQNAKEIKTNLNLDDSLFEKIENNPNDNESKRIIITSILKLSTSLNKQECELYETTKKFQNNLRKNWYIENLVNLCLNIMKEYDDKKNIAFYKIEERMKIFIQSFVNNVINPLSNIFNLINFCDEKKLSDQIRILKDDIFNIIREKNEKKDSLENNSSTTSTQSKDEEEDSIDYSISKEYSISEDNLNHAMKLLNYICRDGSPESQKIKKEVQENKAVLQALAGSRLYLNKRSQTHQQEETELFIKNIITLRNCPVEVIKHEALRYIKCEGNYDSLMSGRSNPIGSDFRLECFIKSGLLSDQTTLLEKNILLENALRAKISIFSPKLNPNFQVKADNQLKETAGLRN